MIGKALIAVACFVLLCNAQNCVFTKNDFYSYEQVWDCFYSVQLSDEVKYTTLQTLNRSIELYPFLDIANNSPDPNLPVQVNMLQGLETIKEKSYKADFDFHNDLRDLYNELYDAHTQYYAPTCYQNIRIRQGFAPIGWGETPSTFTVAVSPYFVDDLVEYYKSSVNIDITQFNNYTILAIDGVNAYDYFLDYANNSVGMSKDIGTRFNFALTVPEPNPGAKIIQYGYWQMRSRRNPFPTAANVVYTLKNPKDGKTQNVTLPWTFQALATYTGLDSFLEDYYDPDANIPHVSSKLVHEEPQAAHEHQWMDIRRPETLELIRAHKEKLVENANVADQTFTMLANSTHLSFWELSDKKTLVMFLDTMAPGAFSGYYPTLIKGFKAAAQRGLTQFIIDLTNNGGGNICLGQSLLAFLQRDGWEGEGQNWGPQDLPLSPLAEQLVNSAVDNNVESTVWSPGFYDNQQDEPIANDDTSYILPGVPHERGGLIRNYSRLLHINDCGEFGYQIDPAVNFSPEKTLIVTHGLCGSTCALFSNHMALYNGVRTLVVGGVPGRSQMQYSSFPGLQVLDNGPLFSQLLMLKQNITWTSYKDDPEDIVPRKLATKGSFRYCIREIYPNTMRYDTKPVEFTFQQADFHYYNTELFATQPQYVWYQALEYFSTF